MSLSAYDSSHNHLIVLLGDSYNQFGSGISLEHIGIKEDLSVTPSIQFFKIFNDSLSSKIFMLNNITFQSMSQCDTVNSIHQKRMAFFQDKVKVLLNIKSLGWLKVDRELPLVINQDWMVVCDYQALVKTNHLNLLSYFGNHYALYL